MVKFLWATAETQGHRASDFCSTAVEPVRWAYVNCEGCSIDGYCSCQRGFVGLFTGRTTTTAVVWDVDTTAMHYRDHVHASLTPSMEALGFSAEEIRAEAVSFADEIMDMVRDWPEGMIVEKRGRKLQTRDCSKCPEHTPPSPQARRAAAQAAAPGAIEEALAILAKIREAGADPVERADSAG